ncbi:MAG: site-2 protease family protein [Planctomycetota bacterium]|jgi:Zn-dependent protease
MERSMGVTLGRIFGTDIRATGGFFLLLAFCFYLYRHEGPAVAGIICIAVLVSLLVHEFGHVFAVRRQLGTESTVILWGLGGLCVHEPARSPRQRIVISLMGPAFTALLGGAMLALWKFAPLPHPVVRQLVAILLWINTIWLVFNLLPIRPLDGGQALESALELKMGTGRAHATARMVSIVFAGLVMAAAYYLDFRFAMVMALLLLVQNLTSRA